MVWFGLNEALVNPKRFGPTANFRKKRTTNHDIQLKKTFERPRAQ
jgi:hypothetical protein